MIVRITGSQLDRVVRCPASAALPQILEGEDGSDGKHRDRGSAIHAYLERVPQIGREAALLEVPEQWRPACADIELAKLERQLKLSSEVALAYNWKADTARLLTPVSKRAYEIDDTCETALTVDLAGLGDGVVAVGDYKSGHGWLPEPNQSFQLGVGALALARIYDATWADVEYIRIRDDGTPIVFRAQLDAFGIEAAAERVRTTMELVERYRAAHTAGETLNVVEGRWCRFCPARQHCPAKTALMRKVISDQPIPYLLPLTPENASHAYALWRKARDTLSMIEGAIHAYAKLTPIPIEVEPDGTQRFFGELRRQGSEIVDGAKAHHVLTARYGGAAANEAVTMETTKAAITDVARKNLKVGEDGRPEKITHVTKAIFEEIKAAGGITNRDTCTTTEYTVSADGNATARKRKAG